uniref:Large ribosomal subunit protein bL9m n=1 Tax=Spermophilus dauricus TaxID=99837 RepID=A0A8C9UN53_SPEDA
MTRNKKTSNRLYHLSIVQIQEKNELTIPTVCEGYFYITCVTPVLTLAGEGRKPRLHRRHRVYKLVEDTKHRPKENLELILTRSVEKLGVRGDLVSVSKSLGRNRLLPQGLAVYASPENRKLFEEEKLLRQEGKLERIQTKAGENLGVVVAPHALKLPEEPITRWGEYWCEVTVNGLDTVRVPMSVVNFEKPRTKRYKFWLAQQAAKGLTSTSSQTV